jgi:Transposase, Mutator family
VAVGDSEDGAFWTALLRSLRARGLSGVRLVISDAHEGLKGAIGAVLLGSTWQRCRVHFLRNVLWRIPKGSAEMVLAAIRTIWAQPDGTAVCDQLDEIAEKLEPRFPAVAAMLVATKEEVTGCTAFPVSHWRKIWSTDESVKASEYSDRWDAGDRRGEEQGFGDVSPVAQPAPWRQRVAPQLRRSRPGPSPVEPARPTRSAGTAPRRRRPCARMVLELAAQLRRPPRRAGAPAASSSLRSLVAVSEAPAHAKSSSRVRRYQMSTVSLRAVATAAICGPRWLRTR